MNKEMYLTEHLVLPSEATLSQTSELNGVRLSPHFSLGEMTVTDVKRVKNIPGPEAIENLKRLCKWLEHLRAQYNLLYDDGSHPIVINQEFDELLIERSKKGTYWVHFAVRAEGNRMKVAFLRG